MEEDESFVKRMSGMIRLYAAIIQQKWPFSSKQGVNSVYTLCHAWIPHIFDCLLMKRCKCISAPSSRFEPRMALAGPDAEHGAGLSYNSYADI